jgi:hypothetical protein
VDIFNEGVDIPDINTILMLRPTESPTIFLQQLGRGLRKTETKSCLVVLDFVGNQNRDFRFDRKYGALLGVGRRRLAEEITADFPRLPIGCHIELDRVSKEIVLANIKLSLTVNKQSLLAEVRNTGRVGAAEFFATTGISPRDFYRSGRSLSALQQEVFGGPPLQENDNEIARAISRLLHIDDSERIDRYISLLEDNNIDIQDPYTMMFAHSIFLTAVDGESAIPKIQNLRKSPVSQELTDVLGFLQTERSRVVSTVPNTSVPLKVHATYSRVEIIAAFGFKYTGAEVSGVQFAKDLGADLAFVTLNKTEKHFSASTMYADTALSSSIFQWESQAATAATSGPGMRYQNHREMGTSFHLFVRDWKNDPETRTTMPYMYFGPADYMSHEGSKPMRIRWHLQFPIPADVLMRSKVIAS